MPNALDKMERSMLSIAAVSIARNEEANIKEMIVSLHAQTVHINPIVVVNDGSSDNTGEIARKLDCIVLDLPLHEESYAGKPELAQILNVGLAFIRELNQEFKYILIVGADHILPPKYLEMIIERMEKNPQLVVASGVIDGERFDVNTPRGSGRIVNYSFWLQVNNLQYPVEWGWESWLYLKAQAQGLETRCFDDVHSSVLRPTSLDKAGMWGKAMYALGYDWKYALARCFLTFIKKPKAGYSMFWNWVLHTNARKLDVAEWVNAHQKDIFWEKMFSILGIRVNA
jgi:glycosyltransferase involved in cell wall biosynthesis